MKSAKSYLPYFIVGFMVLLSGIPLSALQSVISERQTYKYHVEREISDQWGSPLTFGAFKIRIPYFYKSKITKNERIGKDEYRDITKEVINSDHLDFAPSKLETISDVNVEKRYRGIYEVPIYRTQIESTFVLDPINTKAFGPEFTKINTSEVEVILGLMPGKEINNLKVELDGKPVKVSSLDNQLVFKVNNFDNKKSLTIKLRLDYAGTKELSFYPTGKESKFTMKSNWQHPKFIGNRLPSKRKITDKGFEASWDIQKFGNRFGIYETQSTSFGVSLHDVLDIYQLNTRTMKYGTLFIFITVFSLFFIQYVKGTSTHPIQYALVILSMVEFFYILMSFSEHINYQLSYGIASLATIATLGLYAHNIFKDRRAALAVSIELVLLYTFLYFTVSSKDYALLIGSIGLFIIISASMYFTRKIDWSQLDRKLTQLS